jgi:hypothetical protein
VCTGCADAGTSGVSLDEARAQAATCHALIERRGNGPVPDIDPRIFRQAMSDPRLATRSTAEVVLRVCNGIDRRQRSSGSS